MCDGYADGPDLYDERERTARKLHKCSACHESIRPGHRYKAISGKWDGEFSGFKLCLRCDAIHVAIVDAGGEGASVILACGERWEDNFGELPENVAALAFALPNDFGGQAEGSEAE